MPRLALGFALLCFGSSVAAAQSAGNMQLDAYQPAMDARGYMSVNGTSVLDSGELSFGLGSIDWGHRMLDFQAGSASYSVDDMVTSTLVGAAGVRVAGVPFEVGMSLPLTIMNGTDGRVNAQGIGDLGLHLKARLLHLGPVGIGALASVYLPTASTSDGFLGEPGVSSQFEALADVSLGRVRLGINAGVRLQPTQTFTDTMMGTMGTITTSTLLPVGAAAAVALAPEKVELVGEVFGALPAGATKNYESLEALGGVKVYLAKNSYMTLGAGRGLVAENGSPDFRAVGAIVFEPKPAARRVAVVPDDDVATAPPPKPAPDPDADRDGDGVPDKDDKCPDVPGELWNEGCPDTTTVVVGESSLVVLKSIDFEYDSAKLKTTSFPVLDAVVKALQDNPDIELVEVGGHTDERGSDAYNLDLSDRRAASVLTYLSEHGIAASRLTSRGFGKRVPLDPAHSETAWAKNRRVEFVIKQRAGQACGTAGACGASSR